jgi:hypothetical protein
VHQKVGLNSFLLATAVTVEKEGPMAKSKGKGKPKTKKISLGPIVKEIAATKKQLVKAKKVAIASEQKAIDARIKALDKSTEVLMAACGSGTGKAPPLSIIIIKGQ